MTRDWFTFALCAAGILLSGIVHADTSNISVTVFIAECTDGADNDGDGQIDYPSDPGCSSTGDNDETDPVLAVCEDTLDNDGDGLIDYPSDPGCDSLSDGSEVNLSGSGSSGAGSGWTNTTIVRELPVPTGSVVFSGVASPRANVTLLLYGRVLAETVADMDGRFSLSVEDIPAGQQLFGLYAADILGTRAALVNIPLTISVGARTAIGEVTLPATLFSTEEPSKFRGYTQPGAVVRLDFLTAQETIADASGRFEFAIDTAGLTDGLYTASVRTLVGESSTPSLPIQFRVARAIIESTSRRADVDGDSIVGTADFSRLLYWFRRTLSPEMLRIEKEHFNGDGKIDYIDFSILAFNWTN